MVFLYADPVQRISHCAHCAGGAGGDYSTSNFIFLFVIFLLIVKLFHMTIKQSQMETRLRELVQKMAIDEKEERDRAKEKED